MSSRIYIGCAGWSIPRQYRDQFPEKGTHLERYAARLNAVEINSSFYRSHKPETYARWAASVPEPFRFAVKVPREITHRRKLRECSALLQQFLGEVSGLGSKSGPLLLQLPPSLSLDLEPVAAFFHKLRRHFSGEVVCEPRHASWFTAAGENLLQEFQISRAAVDPPPHPAAAHPGGFSAPVYYRLHGSPKMYYSEYDAQFLATLRTKLIEAASSAPVWCIFNNTASGAAFKNALEVLGELGSGD